VTTADCYKNKNKTKVIKNKDWLGFLLYNSGDLILAFFRGP
jgi:putative methionine-R-sulfoxide reductase with GAF domain